MKINENNMMEWFIKMFLTLFIWLCFIMLYTFIGAILWNSVMPDLFGLPEIKWFQMLCLIILANIIIRGFNITYSTTKTINNK